jgi:hypothetical protein
MSVLSTGRSSDSEPLVVKPKGACRMLDCGITRLYELIGAGELQTFLDGRSRKITVASIAAYIARRLDPIEANTSPSPARRGRPRKRGAVGK